MNWTRRRFIKYTVAGLFGASSGYAVLKYFGVSPGARASVFVASADHYSDALVNVVAEGFHRLGITEAMISGKNILLKPNLVEPHREAEHINTHPILIQSLAKAFYKLKAKSVVVAEGAGHCKDSILVLEESGFGQMLAENHLSFIDLNNTSFSRIANKGNKSKLGDLYIPRPIQKADFIVSVAKMKTHHWAGATLSMKNLFGIMPGMVYGWPKNVLHQAGIIQSILDINASVPIQLGVVDGIVGMEGDGPIMGDPIHSNVLVMGRNLPALDATCARIMGLNPEHIPYLKYATPWLGPIREKDIDQLGKKIRAVRKDYKLVDKIPAHHGLRL